MPILSIRISELEKEKLERRSNGGNLSAFCRRILTDEVSRELEIERIHELIREQSERIAVISEQCSRFEEGGIPKEIVSMIFETRLLLQAVSSLEAKKSARAEIERVGLPYVFASDLGG